MNRKANWMEGIEWATVGRGDSKLRTAVVLITPDMAAEMLAESTNYRAQDRKRIQKYAAVMRERKWELNGDTIKCDNCGNNLDGKHRLMACQESMAPFMSLIVCDVKSVNETDRGKGRQFSDAIAHAGYKNAKALAATTCLAWSYETYGTIALPGYDRYPTCGEGLDFLIKNPSLSDCVTIGNRAKTLVSSSLAATIVFCGTEKSNVSLSKGEHYIDGLVNGVEGNFMDARHQLHVRLEKNACAKAKLARRDILATMVKAWNRWLLGLTTNSAAIRWTSGKEAFPDFVTHDEL